MEEKVLHDSDCSGGESRDMKILVITPTYFPVCGGAEVGIFEIFKRLGERNDVRILTPFPSRGLIDRYGNEQECRETEGPPIVRFRDRMNLKNLPGQFALRGAIPPFSLSAIRAAAKQIGAFRPDVACFFYALPNGLAGLFSERIKKIPTVLSLIGRDIPGPGIPYFWKHYFHLIVKRIQSIVFISEYSRKQARGESESTGTVIPFGVDTKKFRPGLEDNPIRKKWNIPPSGLVLFTLLRLDPLKRTDVLIESFRQVLKELDVFLIVGGKGPQLSSLQSLVAESDMQQRVIFPGFIPDDQLPFYYDASDVFIFHSTYETFGVSLVQALAAGLPVVSVNSTAIPEIVIPGWNGLLVEPLDPNALAHAAIELLTHESKRKRMGVESRKLAEKKYDWNLIANQYEDVFRAVIEK